MRSSRRYFLKQLAGVVPVLVGAPQLAGCLKDDEPQAAAAPASSTTSSAQPVQQPPSQPPPTTGNSSPVWEPSPTIEFVEGVPAVIPISQFVQDADDDALVITMKSGALPPGITFNPSNATLAYDGRPLGAKPDVPVVTGGIVFVADDKKN